MQNQMKMAWRSLIRNRRSSLINIFGLSLGIASSLLILLWVRDEYAVDAFHRNGAYLFQIYERSVQDGKTDASYRTQGLLADELKRTDPEVQYAAAFDYAAQPGTKNTLQVADKLIKMTGFYAGEDFFRMFTFPILQGNAATALQAPGGIAISRSLASELFGSGGAVIGKTIRFDDKENLLVTAIFEDIPAHSSLQFDFLRTWPDYIKQNAWVGNWGNQSPFTFLQLSRSADPAKVESTIRSMLDGYLPKIKGFRMELGLQPFSERYLHSTFKDGHLDGGRIEYVRLFTGVALFLLLIACINFINLATAQSAKRAREVGLRKVIGARRGSLILQFIGETFFLTSFSLFISLLVTYLILPMFNQITGKQLSLPLTDPFFGGTLVAVVVGTSLVAGTYPAFFLSSLQPVKVLGGSLKFGWTATILRKGLVVFQFTLSIVLMIGMMVVRRQVDYIQTKNLGYDRDGLIYLPIEGHLVKQYAAFKDEARKIPGITDISKMRNSPTLIEHHTGSISWTGKDPNLQLSFADGVVGYDFVNTMKLQLTAGRDFSPAFSSDSTAFLLNETAVRQMGFEHPLGATLSWGNRRGTVVGVLKDFHFNSLHQAIDPLIVRLDENWPWGTILVRIQRGRTHEAITGLESLCKSLNPDFPFTYQFSDLEFARLYKSEAMVSRLASGFAILAILISCLGLLGLATYSTAQRTREIGIRKVLGATPQGIALLLAGDFLKIVIIAVFISFPIAWLVMQAWLQQYAYKAGMSGWLFAAAGLATLAIAMMTVSYHSVRAALVNPSKSLKDE